MSPIAPRARGRKVAKPVTRKTRAVPKQTHQSLKLFGDHNEDERDSDVENEDPNEDDGQSFALEQQTAQTLEQLHRMSAGLEREVESFAENLDRFLDELRPGEEYDDVHDLVLSFKAAANKEVSTLEKEYGRERREQLAREWITQANMGQKDADNHKSLVFGSRHSSDRGALQVREPSAHPYVSPQAKELRIHQQEVDTWELFKITLNQHYDTNATQTQDERRADLERLGPVHKYTPESDLFQRFILENDLGRERFLVKTWLEESSEYSQTNVDDILKGVEQTKVGGVANTRGWMHTREKIKGEKRLRTWPAPDTSPLPQLRSSDTNELLITSLDPDAPSRQGRALEKADTLQERALWIAAWELLRRGKPWGVICDWAETQKEGWRAVVLGKGMTATDAPSMAIWRHACFKASQNKCSSDYEAAVYGLLGGNITAAEKVCHTFDDRLYAYYSTILTQQFDQYLSTKYPEQVPQPLLASFDGSAIDRQMSEAQEAITDLMKEMRTRSETRNESMDPIKIIQSYLLANQAENLIHTVGSVVPEAQRMLQRKVATDTVAKAQQQPEAGIVKHLTSLRIVTHIAIALQELRTTPLSKEEREAEDNVVAAYIAELNAAGKKELIPLYASRMQPDRAVSAMAIVAEGIGEFRERETILTLMQQKDIDLTSVLNGMLENVLDEVLAQSPEHRPKSILQFTDDELELYPGQRINLDEEPDLATNLDQDFVRHLEWFLVVPQHWQLTFTALTRSMLKLLANGRFACARLVIENFKTDFICQEKTYRILGRSVNLFSPNVSRPGDAQEARLWDIMQDQAKIYYELERLVNVYELLFAWRKQEQLYAHASPRSPSVPKELKTTFQELEEAMEPLLDLDGFLLDLKDEGAKDMEIIRKYYVTDAILAYNTVLFGAGRLISRDMLLKSMDLATVVAKESTRLTETFMQAGRLKELVTSFAFSSKAILVMKATGKPWKPRYERKQGRDVSIWDVTVPKDDNADVDAVMLS